MINAILITIVLAVGPHSVNLARTRAEFQMSKERFAEVGVPIKLNKIISMKDFSGKLNKLSNDLDRLYVWEKWAKRHDIGTIYYVNLPPIVDAGTRWIGGYSSGTCNPHHGVSIGNSEYTNPSGNARLIQSAEVMVHEIGHQLGCPHDDILPVTIMNGNANYYITTSLPYELPHFSNVSRGFMKVCLG